jgi:predicted alpha/beta hydrolase family esterase
MKTSDVDILIVRAGSTRPDHWQPAGNNLATARRIEQDTGTPRQDEWLAISPAWIGGARRAGRHSLGVIAVAYAAPKPAGSVGAFLVAPPDVDNADLAGEPG